MSTFSTVWKKLFHGVEKSGLSWLSRPRTVGMPPHVAEHAYAIIMAGGKGERFWPLSTERHPKQLLSLAGGKALILQAVDRLDGLIPPERILIVTNESLVPAIRRMLGDDNPIGILGEPVGRDTAAAIAAGAAWIKHRDPDAVFCVLTADHIIGNLPVFRKTIATGLTICSANDVLMTIGIPPSEPSSAYGYIEIGETWRKENGVAFCHALRFVEKPDRAKAEEYMATGRYFWNSGMFIWSLRAIQQAFSEFRPVLAGKIDDWAACADDIAFQDALEKDFPALEKISIDYAVMEKAQNIIVCRGEFAWDDVGSWPALESHLPIDPDGNAVQGDMEAVDSKRNIVVSDGRLTALVGVNDLIVVQADSATLICDKSRAQDIKTLVAKLRTQPGRKGIL